MKLVNANELIDAGVGFQIADTDAAFDTDGELKGYREVSTGRHTPSIEAEEAAEMRGFFDIDDAGESIDDFAMLDDCDGDGHHHEHSPVCSGEKPSCSEGCTCIDTAKAAGSSRWAHVRDTHIAEMVADARLKLPVASDSSRDFGEMSYHQIARYRRACELDRYIRKIAWHLRFARRRNNRVAINKCLSLLAKVRSGINERYRASVRLIVQRGRNEWWLLYLKREQRAYLMRSIERSMK